MKIIKITAGFLFLALAFLPLSSFASSDLRVVNYKLNGKEENARLDSSAGGKVGIEINANAPVKFNTIALCATADTVCNRTTAVKYFTKTDALTSTVSKEWDGKTSKGAVAPNGDYKIRVTMKDESGTEKIQELSPYVIMIGSTISSVSSSPNSKSSDASSQSKSASSTVSQSNLDNDPVVKKIRDFIANGGRESIETASATYKSEVKKPIDKDKKMIINNSINTVLIKTKKIEMNKEDLFSSSTKQTSVVVSSEESSHSSFIWKIINLPLAGFNLVKRLFYSGN